MIKDKQTKYTRQHFNINITLTIPLQSSQKTEFKD